MMGPIMAHHGPSWPHHGPIITLFPRSNGWQGVLLGGGMDEARVRGGFLRSRVVRVPEPVREQSYK